MSAFRTFTMFESLDIATEEANKFSLVKSIDLVSVALDKCNVNNEKKKL